MTTDQTCKFPDCADAIRARGWCKYHWRQAHEGRPQTPRRQYRTPGAAAVRDAQGRKQCGRCLTWRPESDYTPSSSSLDGLQTWCSPCAGDYMLLRRYGMTAADIAARVAEQGGCAICKTSAPRNWGFRNGWHVDHDHACCPGDRTCGECIRGILCADCNKVLGLVADDPSRLEAAVRYLRDCERRDAA